MKLKVSPRGQELIVARVLLNRAREARRRHYVGYHNTLQAGFYDLTDIYIQMLREDARWLRTEIRHVERVLGREHRTLDSHDPWRVVRAEVLQGLGDT